MAAIRLLFETVLPRQLTDTLRAVQASAETVAKVGGDDLARIMAAIDLGLYDDVRPELERLLRKMASDRAMAAAQSAARAVNASAEQLERMLAQANLEAITWAEQHAATLVTEITHTTREEVREIVTTGVQEGATNDEISRALQESYAFSKGRSDRIARTETSFAENRGTVDGWRASGLVTGKESLPDVNACPICTANAAQGVIPIDQDFQSGDDAPPYHPNCECSILAVIPEE